ncbi:hypothetical protein ACRPHP_16460 [Pantoea allii]|uniref:hypothetical protein n=1 Tax=Pantoea allii TaxID=574096 RepID=UPI003D7AFC2A
MPEPVINGVCTEILNAYAVISRSRRYAGMVATPLPLSLDDISSYLALNPLLIDRDEFEAAIFALDDAARDKWEEKQKAS